MQHPARRSRGFAALVAATALGVVLAGLEARPSRASERHPLDVAGRTVEVELDGGAFDLPTQALLDWVDTSARAVASFYGRFPVERVRVRLVAASGKGVSGGRTDVGGELIRVVVGRASDREDLAQDWIMTHEMVHLAFPSVPRQHHWIEEGLATYVEPLARLEIGEVSAEQVWRDLVVGLPNGLPREGDRGLDHTPTWGRTYWGGALFCLLADLEIRERTGNTRGLRDALRGIQSAGGSMRVRWSLEEALRAGDAATGVPVLMELYERMRAHPAPVDLDALWSDLGVEARGRRVQLRSDAPRAEVRSAITYRPEAKTPVESSSE